MERNNGITLIALVITIIVLLILSGISIQMISGNNGIIGKAIDAKNQMEDAQDFELLSLKVIESSSNKGLPNIDILVPKLQDIGCTVTGESFPLTVSYKEKKYKIEDDGTLQVANKTEEYKEVEYIETTGTQYIDTGYIPKTNTKLELTLSFSGEFSPTETNTVLFSTGSIEENNVFSMNFGGNSSRI